MIIAKRIISPLLGAMIAPIFVQKYSPKYMFAFMSLFQQPKKPQQLSSVFKKPQRIKGHMKQKKRKGYVSPKLNKKVKATPIRIKNHSGMLKRVKIVGPRWNRRFKRLSAQNYHLKRKKTLQNLKRKSRTQYISKADMWRVRRMIPYFKRKSLKRLY